MSIQSVIHTNQHSIDRVLQAGLPVLLVFWQPQQGLPQPLTEALDRLAATYAGKALVAKIDSQAEPGLVTRYGVNRQPTCVFVKQGRVEATLPGVIAAAALERWLAYVVDGGQRPSSAPVSDSDAERGAAAAGGTGNGSQEPVGKPVVATDGNFAQIIGGSRPVLVDFWAAWCGPCRAIAPAVAELAQEFQGRAVIAKLNVDENPQTAQRYGVMSIPTLFIFKHGQIVDKLVGAQPAAVLRQQLNRHLG